MGIAQHKAFENNSRFLQQLFLISRGRSCVPPRSGRPSILIVIPSPIPCPNSLCILRIFDDMNLFYNTSPCLAGRDWFPGPRRVIKTLCRVLGGGDKLLTPLCSISEISMKPLELEKKFIDNSLWNVVKLPGGTAPRVPPANTPGKP